VNFSMRALVIAALGFAAASNLSCKVNDYCLECQRGDGGPHDSGPGGDGDDGGGGMDGSGSGSSCVPSNGGVEICDGKDNDCNGLIDDGTLPEVGSDCDNVVGECAGGTKVCVTKFHCSVSTTTECFSATDTDHCPAGEQCVAEDVTTDHLGCTKNPSFEICDGKDNNCNGTTDEGDPGGGTTVNCGTDLGECSRGVNHCINGTIQCQGAIGGAMPPYGSPEICDGKDNNCNGMFDEGLTNMGTCGQSGTSPCMLGTLQCIGGAPQCVGAVDPTFEVCDGVDNDCNGTIDDGYNKVSDPNNCGPTCQQCTVPASFNANPVCTSGVCGFACKPGYKDLNGNAADGCEFGPCFATGPEVCDGIDNNCNGAIDEGVTINNFCATKGECAGTTPTCTGMGGWVCNYPSTVEQSGGVIVAQETRCDTKDNDCDGRTDEGTPNLGDACHDTGVGACEQFGTYVCDSSNISGPAVCNYTSGGGTASAEACNNQDDDCDGNVDEDLNTGNPVGISWVNIGNGVQMAEYEMSKPDATGTDPGSVTAHACSKAGVEPWVDVTYPQAVAACATIGGRLCSEEEWHRSCSVVAPTTYPVSVDTNGVLLEAEDFAANTFNPPTTTTHSWVEDETSSFSGIGDMQAIPNNATTITAANAPTNSPRLDYTVNVATAGTMHVWVKLFANSSNADNKVWTGVSGNATLVTGTAGTSNTWVWVNTNVGAVTTGAHTVSVYMQQDGVRIDQVFIVIGTTSAPSTTNPAGNKWAFQTSPNTYATNTCNGHDYFTANISSVARASNVVTVTTSAATPYVVGDQVQLSGVTNASFNGTFTVTSVISSTQFTFSQTAANQSSSGGTVVSVTDNLLPTGSLSACLSTTGGGIFDMSGNAKEWVLAHQPGQNPIRGGSANNIGNGISCPLNFTLADDTFFFTNVGFRCCR